ncbi:MAG: diguanylate cyclase [Solirubrobacterales bacterium]
MFSRRDEGTSPGAPGGDGYLRYRLAAVPELEQRRRTALRDWIAATVVVTSQQLTPFGVKLSLTFFLVMCGFAAIAIAISWLIYPRVPYKRLLKYEQAMMMIAWVGTAVLVYASGGAGSPYIFFYAQSMIYSAYFFARSPLLYAQIALGTIATSLPIFYDFDEATSSNFIPTIAIALAVWWTICAVIAIKRRAVLNAECDERRLALTDPLTGLANRRAIEEFAEDIRGSDEDHFAVAVVDLNGLKRANGDFGHVGGDDLIRRIGAALCKASRVEDQVARTGGDEFLVLMPGGDSSLVALWRARLSDEIATDNDHRERRPILSVSVGTAVAPIDGSDLDGVVEVADRRMYGEKAAAEHQSLVDDRSVRQLRGGHALRVPDRRRLFDVDFASFDAPAGTTAALVVAVGLGWAIHATEAYRSVLSSVVLMVVAYFAYFGNRREAVIGSGATLLAFTVAFFGSEAVSVVGQTRFLTIIFAAAVIAYALQTNGSKLTLARQRAKDLAAVDALTGVANRRLFERDVAAALESAEAGDQNIAMEGVPALILVDIHDFKNVNTRLGHLGGDELLRRVATALRDAVGDDGAVYRIGGDEFAVLCGAHHAQRVETIVRRCDELIRAIDSDGSYVQQGVSISACLGFTRWQPGATKASLVGEADQKLMACKSEIGATRGVRSTAMAAS